MIMDRKLTNEKNKKLIDLFESYAMVLEDPPDDVKYVILWWEEENERTEMEFHSERPTTIGVGGPPGNWPTSYQVWELVEDYDGTAYAIKDTLVMRICETIMDRACGEREAAYTLNLLLGLLEATEGDWDVVVQGLNEELENYPTDPDKIDSEMIDLVALIHDNKTAVRWLQREIILELLVKRETE